MDRGTHCRGGVLPRRLPGAERGQTTTDNGGIWSNRHPASEEQNPRRGRRDTSTERSLTEVREAHWRAPAAAATLEEEIEQLSWPVTRGQLEAQAHSRSQDHHRWISRDQKRRHCQVQLEDSHALTLNITLPGGVQNPKKMKRLPWIST